MPASLDGKQPPGGPEERGALPAKPAPFIPPAAFEAAAVKDYPGANRAPLRLRRRWHMGAGAALAILAIALSAWLMLGRSTPSGVRVNAVAAPPPVPVLPEPVRRAIEEYQVRASLFADHAMTCEDLARGLAAVDAQWVQYNLGRRPAAAARDAGPVTEDAVLTREVEKVEDAFGRTGCPRP